MLPADQLVTIVLGQGMLDSVSADQLVTIAMD